MIDIVKTCLQMLDLIYILTFFFCKFLCGNLMKHMYDYDDLDFMSLWKALALLNTPPIYCILCVMEPNHEKTN